MLKYYEIIVYMNCKNGSKKSVLVNILVSKPKIQL